MSWCGPFWIDPIWNSVCFLYLDICLFFQFRDAFSSSSSNMFSAPFSPFCSWDSYNVNVSILDVSEVCPYFLFFFFFYLASVISTTLSSAGWFIPVSSNLLLIPYSVFFHFIYCILHLCLVFFMFSHSLLNTSHFSLCLSVLSWGLWSSLWSWPWTLYQVDRLSPLSLSSSGVFISFLHLEHVLLSPNLQFLFLCIW